MKSNDMTLIAFNATIYAKDLRVGMKFIDYIGVMPSDNRCEIFTVNYVVVEKDRVIFRAKTEDDSGYYDFVYEELRIPEEPKMRVFFSSIEEGLGYGIAKEDIEET